MKNNHMLRKSFLMLFTFLWVTFLQSSISVMAQTAQTQQSMPAVRPFTDLTLEISSSKEPLLPLQPIPIVVKQSNETSQPVLGYYHIDFSLPLYLYVQKVGTTEKTRIASLTAMHILTEYKNSEIAPKTARELRDWLTLDLDKYFSEPGTYQLQMILINSDGTQRIESNTVNIEIRKPTGMEIEVYNLIKTSTIPSHFFSGLDFNKAENLLEKIVTNFPNSGYSKSAIFLLGQTAFYRKQYSQALIYLSKLQNDKDFIFTEKVKNYLDEIQQSQNIQQKQ